MASKGDFGEDAPQQQSDEVLQAIVLADSFDTKFYPITIELPRSLLPLANRPMLDYTLEFLVAAGVQEIFVFCCWQAGAIQHYLSESRWTTMPNVTIRTIVSPKCVSTGDALRAIYNLHIIEDDFILVSGDVVSNMKLDPVLQAHKLRRKTDKRAIMTVVLKQASPNHRTRSVDDDTVIVVDPQTNQLLHLENYRKKKSVTLPTEVLGEHASAQFRYDLIDCRIDVCSPEVLQVCEDNFDYGELRQDVIRGIVVDDVYKYKIFTHTISDEYAARVSTPSTYVAVSKDIIYRWTHPMVPDFNFAGDTTYSYSRYNIYKEDNIKLARSCEIVRDTVIGSGTEIGALSRITQSVIGRNCKIGANVVIDSSILWDNVVVEDGVHIINSIVCSKVRLLTKSKVSKGCILSFRVVVGPGVTLPNDSKVTTCDEDDVPHGEILEMAIGAQGYGFLWTNPEEEAEEAEAQNEDTDSETETEPGTEESDSETDPETTNAPDAEERKWVSEVKATIRRAVEEDHKLDNLRLESRALKLTFEHRTFYDMALIAIKTLMDIAMQREDVDASSAASQTLRRWGRLLEGYLNSSDEQLGLILGLQKYCEENRKAENTFMHALHVLYDLEIVEEDAVFEWEEKATGPEKRFVQQCQPFLNWLKEAEEDDSDEDSDESD